MEIIFAPVGGAHPTDDNIPLDVPVGGAHRTQVRRLELLQETEVAAVPGLVPPRGLTLLIDIGGGTWISRLFDRDGEIIDQSSDQKGGVYKLATSIGFDDRLIHAIGTRPEPGVIMNGFANQDLANSWRSQVPETKSWPTLGLDYVNYFLSS